MKDTKEFLCSAMTAEGPTFFYVDSPVAFQIIKNLSEMGSNEAEEWGGLEFNIQFNADENDPKELERANHLDIEIVKKAYSNIDWDTADEWDDDSDNPAEDAYMALVMEQKFKP